MPKYLLQFDIYDEHGDEILTASAPPWEDGPEQEFAGFESVVQMLRIMKSQNQRTLRWEFNINPGSARAEFFEKLLRLIR